MPRKARKTRWIPYVGDDGPHATGPVAEANVLKPPDNFKTFEHACCVCADPSAPFGTGFPKDQRWYCRKHAGAVMPEIDENILKNKLKEIKLRSIKAAAAWLEMYLAADKGEVIDCRLMYDRIRSLTVETSDFLKSIELDRKEAERKPIPQPVNQEG